MELLIFAKINFAVVTGYVSYIIYGVLALIALWGAFCAVMAWRRVKQTNFRSESDQAEFLKAAEHYIAKGDMRQLHEMCDGDMRALPQLTLLAAENRKVGFARLRVMLTERFQRDVLAELDYRVSWVKTVIKSAPMVGLLGTVVGMMGAFNKLSSEAPDPSALASDIMLALITTACGLAIAIPLVQAITAVNVQVGRLEDLAGSGLSRVLDSFKHSKGQAA